MAWHAWSGRAALAAQIKQAKEELQQLMADSIGRTAFLKVHPMVSKELCNLIEENERLRAVIAAQAPAYALNEIEQYRLQMAGITTAALGYWKEGDAIHPDYDTPALRDVAKLYAKYGELFQAAPQPAPTAQEPIHTTVLIDWLAARYRAAGGKDGITDLSAFCEEVMRWTEHKQGITGAKP